MAVTCHYPLIFKGKLIIKFLFMWLFIPLMSKFCWIQPAQCKNYCLILYIRKMLQILSILYTGGPQLLLCICILWTSAKDRSVQRQNREDRWFPRHKGCHVKMHPCTVRRGLVGWLVGGATTSYELLTMPSWHLYIGISLQFKLTQRLWFTASDRWFPQWSKFMPSLKQFPQQSGSCVTW